jgi:hypothetical protein
MNHWRTGKISTPATITASPKTTMIALLAFMPLG